MYFFGIIELKYYVGIRYVYASDKAIKLTAASQFRDSAPEDTVSMATNVMLR